MALSCQGRCYPIQWPITMNPHSNHTASPIGIAACAWQHRQLIIQIVRREITGRYRGSLLGLAWSFLTPLLMLAVYTTFFTVMLQARWGGEGQNSHGNFTVILFVGLIVHSMFSECINRAPSLIVQNANYVKKIVFPLEILPWIAVSSALVHAGIGLIVLLIVQIAISGALPWTLVFLPLVIAPFLFVILGFTWFLSALGVFVRDIAQLTGMLTSVMLFMSPIFYSTSSLPERVQPWIALNPLTFIIEQSRNVLIYSAPPDWGGLVRYSIAALSIAWLGFWWFQKTRKGFADVL